MPSLPAKGLVLLGAVVLLVVYVVFVVVVTHPRFHMYWRNQPVPWTTVGSQPEGLVQSTWAHPPRPRHSAASFGTQLRPLPTPVPQRDAKRIARFVTAHSAETNVTTEHAVRAAGSWFVLEDGGGGAGPPQLAAVVSSTSVALDTPLHVDLPCHWIDNLCVRPDRRGSALCTVLIDAVVAAAANAASGGGNGSGSAPPVGAFASERPLPFAHAAAFTRYFAAVEPALLIDPERHSVSHRVVRSAAELPHRAFEGSTARVRGGRTLEPSPASNAARWRRVLRDPAHTLLSVDGTEWVHLAEGRDRASGAQILYVKGFSFDDPARAAMHVQAYVKQRYASVPRLQLVVTAPFHRHVLAGNAEAASEWTPYDRHRLYFYNYRLDRRTVHVPFNWDL
jgi:hypothetical protein